MYTDTEERIVHQAEWRSFFKSSTLLLLAFATVFFSRLVELAGAPSVINFVHFAIVPLASGFVLLQHKTRNRAQLKTTQTLLAGLFVFLCIEMASALLNSAGLVNVVLDFLLLAEPLIFLTAIISLPLSHASVSQFRTWFIRFNLFNIVAALFQRFIFQLHLNRGLQDNIQGVFYDSGSGHVVSASVSLSFAVYFFFTAKERPLWQRSLVLTASAVHVISADAKQVVLISLIGFAILALTKVGDIQKVVLYTILAFVLFFVGYWAIYQFEVLEPFRTWIRPGLYGPNGEATRLKFVSIEIILSHYRTGLEWFLGLGPGHTVDRLGGWMIRDYGHLLNPLGATTTIVGPQTWQATSESWLGDQSSFFSPFWGWVALWGDLGFLGLGSYVFLLSVVWRRLCIDDVSKFILITIVLHGFVFTQMEEPGYVLSMTTLIGLRWQERRSRTLYRGRES